VRCGRSVADPPDDPVVVEARAIEFVSGECPPVTSTTNRATDLLVGDSAQNTL